MKMFTRPGERVKQRSIQWRHGLTDTSEFNKVQYRALHLGQKKLVQQDSLESQLSQHLC